MKKPGWATFVGIMMLLFGGCGAFNNIQNTKATELAKFQEDLFEEIDREREVEKAKADTATHYKPELTEEERRVNDSIAAAKLDKFLLGDTIVRDSANNVDLAQTMKNNFSFSEYRLKWTERFAYIGLFISLLFVVSGVFFLSQRKWTIQIGLLTLVLSLALGIFKLFIYKADQSTGGFISTVSNIGIYTSMFLDIAFLIIIMAVDKTYYNESPMTEDYYD